MASETKGGPAVESGTAGRGGRGGQGTGGRAEELRQKWKKEGKVLSLGCQERREKKKKEKQQSNQKK